MYTLMENIKVIIFMYFMYLLGQKMVKLKGLYHLVILRQLKCLQPWLPIKKN